MGVGEASVASKIEGVLDRLLEDTGADAAELFVRESGGSRMWLAAHRGLAERDFRERTDFELGEGFPGLVAERGEPILTLELDRDGRYLRPRPVRRGFRCYLCVPVRAGEEIVGSLHVASRGREDAVVGRAGQLGEAAELLAALLELDRLRAKDRIGAPAAPELDAKRNMRRRVALALEAMVEVTGADGGIVLLRDPRTGTLHPWGWSGAFDRACAAVTHGSGACSCTVIHEGRGIVAPSRADGTPKRCRVAPADFARVACLPLVAGGAVLGAVSLGYGTRARLPGHLMSEFGAMTERLALEVHNAQAAVAGEERAAAAHELSMLGDLEELLERHARLALQRAEDSPGDGAIEVHDLVAQVRAAARAPVPPSGPHLDVRCLGELVVYRDGQRIDASHVGRRRTWTLLKILLAEHGRTVDDEVLIDRLWPDEVPPGAAKQLKVLVHDLRRALAPGPQPAEAGRFVVRRGSGYAFDTHSSHRVDSREFASLVSRGERKAQHGDVDGALAAYRAAADLYAGDFLADERYSDWCAPERDWLRERHLTLLRHTATLLLARDDPDGAIDCHRRALRMDDTLEDVHAELIALLLQAGRRDDALRQYEACRRALGAALGREPRPETAALVAGLGSAPDD